MSHSSPDPSTVPSRRRASAWRLIADIGLLLTVVVVTLSAIEGILAMAGQDPPDPPLYPGERTAARGIQADSLVGWKMPPDTAVRSTAGSEYAVTYRADSTGFRRASVVGHTAARHRLVFLGDSFTFGSGVEYEQTFAARLERDLQDTHSYDFGMTGFGVDQMWRTFHEYGRRVAPTLVILTFIDDDLHRSLTAYRERGTRGPGGIVWWWKPTYRLAGDSLVPETEADRPNAVVRLITRHSHLDELLRRVSWRLSLQFGEGPEWRLNDAIFRAVHDETRASGARLLVVRLPAKGQWSPAAPAIRRGLARDGIEFVDLATVLPPRPLDYYFRQDPHLNPRGHQWVAEVLERAVVARGWEQSSLRGP